GGPGGMALVGVPRPDGRRRAAGVWLPADAHDRPVPAVLEYIPYRKNDGTAVADEGRHGWFARRGYAGVRVDIRGSGDSDGILLDEYLRQGQDGALEVIAWIAAQPWGSGGGGAIRPSGGRVAALAGAAARPPAPARTRPP